MPREAVTTIMVPKPVFRLLVSLVIQICTTNESTWAKMRCMILIRSNLNPWIVSCHRDGKRCMIKISAAHIDKKKISSMITWDVEWRTTPELWLRWPTLLVVQCIERLPTLQCWSKVRYSSPACQCSYQHFGCLHNRQKQKSERKNLMSRQDRYAYSRHYGFRFFQIGCHRRSITWTKLSYH